MEVRKGEVIINVDRTGLDKKDQRFVENQAILLSIYLPASLPVKQAASAMMADMSIVLKRLVMVDGGRFPSSLDKLVYPIVIPVPFIEESSMEELEKLVETQLNMARESIIMAIKTHKRSLEEFRE